MPECCCVRAYGEFAERRLVCDRTDEHPQEYGTDAEGHHWVEATPQRWRAAIATIHAAWDACR